MMLYSNVPLALHLVPEMLLGELNMFIRRVDCANSAIDSSTFFLRPSTIYAVPGT
uniref:Uncharacterized protein n=1 Tax=Anguilla anguilla TaxID=7936 RepID=A0A0E9SF79_ANGAN